MKTAVLLFPALLLVGFGLTIFPQVVDADPCLVVYPESACTYHYESAEYYTVGPGHPRYIPAFDRGGEVLLEAWSNEIPLDIYQAPNLTGFVLDEENQGYYVNAGTFNLIVDGFNNRPCTYENIVLVFDTFAPGGCLPAMVVDGMSAVYAPGCGWHCPLGSLEVSTPTLYGNNYSDTMTCFVQATGCIGVRVWAFDDENQNLVHDGGECFTAFSHDAVVPVGTVSWGEVKKLQ